jgi:HSP20 family protein
MKANGGQAVTRRTGQETTRAVEHIQPTVPIARFFNLSPFALMREFTDEMDRALNGRGDATAMDAWAPAIDVQQCNGTLTVTAELPGLKREDVKVELTDDNLIIEGERRREHQTDHDGFHRYERSYGHFYRAVPLPEGTKTEQLKAELKDGVLKVSAPIPEMKKKHRQIAIDEGGKTNQPAA